MSAETITHPAAQPLRIPATTERSGRRRLGVTGLFSCMLLSAVVLLIVVAIGGMTLGLWRFTVIDTGSMRPTLNPGDVAILTSEPLAALRRGQIVAFHPPGEPRLTVVHRVYSLRRVRGSVVIQTKGDANNATDPWHAHLVGDTVWRESLKASKLGYLSVWSGQRPVRLGLLIVIVVLLTGTLLGTIWRSSPREA
jgi:signal peptidase I